MERTSEKKKRSNLLLLLRPQELIETEDPETREMLRFEFADGYLSIYLFRYIGKAFVKRDRSFEKDKQRETFCGILYGLGSCFRTLAFLIHRFREL